ncbi:MAG: hypothetical protein L0H23_00030 [Luteimonas sp.]|nr:hypothetical protein [Luteimonas sp.]
MFAVSIALLLLAAVIAGFWNTFLFRDGGGIPLKPHLVLHGSVVAGWFVLFAAQALLVSTGNVAMHRRLGVLGVVVAAGVVATSLFTILQIVHGWRADDIDVDAQRGLIGLIAWGDLGALAAYVVFLVRGLYKRRRPDAHRRLMLLASFSIISLALIRIAALPAFAGIDGILLTIGGLLLLAAILVLHDLMTLHRVHRETLWGVPFFLIVHLAPAFTLPGTALDAWLLGLMW